MARPRELRYCYVQKFISRTDPDHHTYPASHDKWREIEHCIDGRQGWVQNSISSLPSPILLYREAAC